MKSITVFCGSSEGYVDVYMEQAYTLGKVLAEKGIKVIYGGAKVGLMGAVADGVLNNNGHITGVIPHFLRTKEVAHDGLTELLVVDSMHERKLKMYDLCEGVITLPGGWGTMDEMFEMLTWSQLGMHTMPVGILNINNYYDALTAFITSMVQEGFLNENVRKMLLSSDNIETLLEKMEEYRAPDVQQFISEQTI